MELVDDERFLTIGVYQDNVLTEEIVTTKFRRIFTQDDDDEGEDTLFPELKHAQSVQLEGEVTRGNERANSIGFGYQGHIITCLPKEGSIVRFKATLFLKCRIHGVISRSDDKGGFEAKRPKIIFTNIELLEDEENNLPLFD